MTLVPFFGEGGVGKHIQPFTWRSRLSQMRVGLADYVCYLHIPISFDWRAQQMGAASQASRPVGQQDSSQ